jgi:hypothetical protein
MAVQKLIVKKPSVLAVLTVLLLAAGLAQGATLVMPLAQVKSGMKGRGKSVFEGGRVDEFDVEILGVLENVQPKRNTILARLRGRGLETTGVIAGMSGSPVYVDGKIIGAVAYSFPYAKEAIAGITPIEEMLAIPQERRSQGSGSAPALPLKKDMSLADLAAIAGLSGPVPESAAAGRLPSRLRLPLVFSGFSAPAFERARPFFSALGFDPLRGGGTLLGAGAEAAPGPLGEGDPVAVQLVGGDLDMSAVGTVTYVDGATVLAFGHPFYNLGAVDFGMARASVIAVVPSLESSFKVSATGPLIGRFSQDRTAGVRGEVGVLPVMIPLNITLETAPLQKREIKLRIVNDRVLSAALVNMAVASLITSEERSYGDLSVDFSADIYLDGGRSVHLEDLFSGNYGSAEAGVSGLCAAAVYYLTNNEFRDVGIYRIDLSLRTTEQTRLSTLDRVLLDKYEVAPGEPIGIKVYYRTTRQEGLLEEVQVRTPDLPAGSEFQLVVGDAAAMQQVERTLYRTQDFVPRSLDQLLRLLGNLRKNNRIYFKVVAARPGLFLRGEELPNLPPSLKSMFASPRAAASAPTELTRSTLAEYQLPLPYVFRGAAVIPVKIRK